MFSVLLAAAAAAAPVPAMTTDWWSDYYDTPKQGLAVGELSVVLAEITVNTYGGFAGCVGHVYTGNPQMGPYVCSRLKMRAVFKPARAPDGRKVVGIYRKLIIVANVRKETAFHATRSRSSSTWTRMDRCPTAPWSTRSASMPSGISRSSIRRRSSARAQKFLHSSSQCRRATSGATPSRLLRMRSSSSTSPLEFTISSVVTVRAAHVRDGLTSEPREPTRSKEVTFWCGRHYVAPRY